MATIQLDIKPLTVNKAWQGKRFTTKDYKKYTEDCLLLLPRVEVQASKYEIIYRFYLIHHKTTDYDNLIKPLQDIIVKKGIIPDDKYIYRAVIEKIPSTRDYIEIEIIPFVV